MQRSAGRRNLPAGDIVRGNSCALPVQASTAGMIATSSVIQTLWRTARLDQTASGTASRTRCRIRSSRWRWIALSSHHANWRFGSRMIEQMEIEFEEAAANATEDELSAESAVAKSTTSPASRTSQIRATRSLSTCRVNAW